MSSTILDPLSIPINNQSRPLRRNLRIVSRVPNLNRHHNINSSRQRIRGLNRKLHGVHLTSANETRRRCIKFNSLSINRQVHTTTAPRHLLLTIRLPNQFIRFRISTLMVIMSNSQRHTFHHTLPSSMPIRVNTSLNKLKRHRNISVNTILTFLQSSISTRLSTFITSNHT